MQCCPSSSWHGSHACSIADSGVNRSSAVSICFDSVPVPPRSFQLRRSTTSPSTGVCTRPTVNALITALRPRMVYARAINAAQPVSLRLLCRTHSGTNFAIERRRSMSAQPPAVRGRLSNTVFRWRFPEAGEGSPYSSTSSRSRSGPGVKWIRSCSGV